MYNKGVQKSAAGGHGGTEWRQLYPKKDTIYDVQK